MKRIAVVVLGGAMLAMAACSFGSLDYLQNGPPDDGGSGEIAVVDGSGITGHLPEVLARSQTAPSQIAQDDTALYWASANGVMSVSKTGGPARMISPATTVNSLAVDKGTTGNVYLAFGPTVTSVPKASSPSVPIFTENDGGAVPYEVAVDDTTVYLLQYDNSLSLPARVIRMGKDGSGLQELALTSGYDPATLNIDDTNVVWSGASGNDSAFFQTPKAAAASAPPTMLSLATNDTLPLMSAEVIVASDKMFWTDETNVFSRTHDPIATTVTIYKQDANLTETFIQLAYDGTNLYALDSNSGAVRRIAPDGTKTDVVTSGIQSPTSLVVDSQYLYLTVENTGVNGQVVRILK